MNISVQSSAEDGREVPMVSAQWRPQSEPRGVDCLPADLSVGTLHGMSHKPHSQCFLGLTQIYQLASRALSGPHMGVAF